MSMSFFGAFAFGLATIVAAAAPASLPEYDTVVDDTRVTKPLDPPPPPDPSGTGSAWDEHPFSLEAHLGIAAPTGAIGGVVDYAIVPWLSLGCGFGTNFVGPAGECRLRLRWIYRREKSLYLGAGVSGGPHVQTPLSRAGVFAVPLAPLSAMGHGPPPAAREWEFAKWCNVELGFERRRFTGGVIRPYVGVAVLLNPDESTIDASQAEIEASDYAGPVEVANTLLYGGFAFGRAL